MVNPFILIGIIGVVIVIVAVSASTVRGVGSGERGVVTHWSAVDEAAILQPGIHTVTPLQDSVINYDVQTQKISANASAASKDLQEVRTEVTVNYHIEPTGVALLHKEIGTGYREIVLAPSIQEAVKQNTAKYNADELITKRETVKASIESSLRESMQVRHIVLETVLITQFDFSNEFNKAIEAKVSAQQKALEAENKLKQVEFEAQQTIAQANGQAESIRIINEQIKASPQYIHYLEVQRWDGKLPTFMGTANVPFIVDLTGQVPN